MFLRFAKKKQGSRIVEYAQIAEKYREGEKQKTRVLNHLGPVRSEDDRNRYREIFQAKLRRARVKDTDLEKLDFGTIYAVKSVMDRTGIFRSLSILGKYRETAFLMNLAPIYPYSASIQEYTIRRSHPGLRRMSCTGASTLYARLRIE